MSSEVPEGWTQSPLGTLADITRGVSWRDENETNKTTFGALPVLGIRNVQQSLKLDETVWLGGLSQKVVASSTVRFGDILMVGSNGNPARIGNAVRVNVPGVYLYASLLFGVRPDEAQVDGEFLFQMIRSAAVQQAISDTVQGSTGLANLKITVLRDIPILLPPLDEQRRIADVLRSVGEAIGRTKAAADQARRAVEGLLQRVFIEGIGDTNFKDGHSTPIPVSWTEMALGDVSAMPITYGVVQPGPNVPDGVPFVRGGDFPDGKINLGALRKIGDDVAAQYRRTRLRGGEIVISLVGYPGACAIVPDTLIGANIARQTALIRPAEGIFASYLYQFLRSPIGQARLKKETIGSAQQVINLRDLKGVIVPVPPFREQEQIATVLAELDAFVELETASFAKLSTLKAHLMSDLLSGRVRVPA